MRTLVLKAQFIDRIGRNVYLVIPVEPEADPHSPDNYIMKERPAVGMLRMLPFDDNAPAAVEWFKADPEPGSIERSIQKDRGL